MTASIRILTNASIDCNPSLLIVSPNGSKTLVNCSEGCQRSFLESASVNYGASGACVPSLRIRSVNRVCLTHIGHDATGGLPGMILTTADVVDSIAREMANNSANKRTTNNNGGGDRGGGDRDGGGGGGGGRANGNNNKNNQRQENNNGRRNNNNNRNNRKRNGSLISNHDDEEEGMPDLEIVGPVGTKSVLHSLRHFMRRDRFKVHAHEGHYDSSRNDNSVSNGCASKKKKKSKKKRMKETVFENDKIGFDVESIPVEYGADVEHYDMGDDEEAPPQTRQVVSYLFTTMPIPGKFLVEKAQALNVPRGRMYGILKGGKSVTFTDPTTNEERTVTSEEVVGKSSPGVGVAVICCPTFRILSKLKQANAFRAFENYKNNDNNNNNDDHSNNDNGNGNNNKKSDEGVVKLEVMVHLTPESVFRTPAYRSWCETFGPRVDHITLHTVDTLEARAALRTNSPFVSGIYGGVRRSFVSDALFPMPSCTLPGGGVEEEAGGRRDTAASSSTEVESEIRDEGEEGDSPPSPSSTTTTTTNVIEGRPMMDYVLMPRSRRGLNESTLKCLYSADKMERLEKKVNECGAVECAVAATTTTMGNPPVRGGETNNGNDYGDRDRGLGELIFTGTGSAVPCKHRNVTGMYLRMNNGNSMLLDVGEGTVGQLLHSWKSTLLQSSSSSSSSSSGSDEKEREAALIDEYRTRLKGIKAVWISHPHADHHLGLLRLLSERAAHCGSGDPIVLMAPHDMFDFLAEYRRVVPELDYSYIPVDCSDMIHGRRNPLGDKLHDDLGITLCASVPVAHCQRSYAVVVDGTPFGRVAYSGDCRPSNRFADVAYGADLLIHEATFEDGMEEDAVMKRHSTVGEAIGVAGRMNAGALVLTHFSQRYPKIPPLNEKPRAEDDEVGGKEERKKRFPIAFAFDFMRLAPHTIELAAKLTPALRLLYPGEEESEMDTSTSNNAVTAKELMAVPGVFAAKGVL